MTQLRERLQKLASNANDVEKSAMHIDTPKPECSVCCSTQQERFSGDRGTGIRCLNCGHESVARPESQSESAMAFVLTNNTKATF